MPSVNQGEGLGPITNGGLGGYEVQSQRADHMALGHCVGPWSLDREPEQQGQQ